MATKEPWRMALAYLLKTYGEIPEMDIPFLNDIQEEKINIVKQALDLNINTPLTSSTGRLFDAAAALTGLCHIASFHAEAINPNEKGAYPFVLDKAINTSSIIKGICKDMDTGTSVSDIAARFHNSVINIIFAAVEEMAKRSCINKVVLSGGSFQNKYILENTESMLLEKGYEVYIPFEVPANDGGIALGQLAIAAARRRKENQASNNKVHPKA